LIRIRVVIVHSWRLQDVSPEPPNVSQVPADVRPNKETPGGRSSDVTPDREGQFFARLQDVSLEPPNVSQVPSDV
jgi:hypothetical protein